MARKIDENVYSKTESAKPKDMSPEEAKRLDHMCRCPGCPTYPNKGDRIMYCFTDKSTMNPQAVTCYCPGCPVSMEKGFGSTMYFCLQGSAKKILGI